MTRGKYPSCTAWRVSENTPEMSACDATTVAAVDRMTMGMSTGAGNSAKNGFSAAAG